MSRTRYFALCLLVLAGAFAGGYAANRTMPVAHAQVIGPPENIRAASVTLVNQQGQAQAILRTGPAGAELGLNDQNGKSRIEISPAGGVVVRDANGFVTWRTPKAGFLPAHE